MNLSCHNFDLCNIVSGLPTFELTWSAPDMVHTVPVCDHVLNPIFSPDYFYRFFFLKLTHSLPNSLIHLLVARRVLIQAYPYNPNVDWVVFCKSVVFLLK